MTKETTITDWLRDITQIVKAICPGSRPRVVIDPDAHLYRHCNNEGDFVRVGVEYALPGTDQHYTASCTGPNVVSAVSDLRDALLEEAAQQRDALKDVLKGTSL